VRLGLEVLQERSFRSLFFARALSLLGDGIVPVALAFAVLGIDRSATALGIVLAAQGVPRLALMLVGGVLGDRLPRRAVMIASDLVRFVAQGVVAALLISHRAELWHLAVLGFVYGGAASFFIPASTGLIPQVVSKWRLQEANALVSVTASSFSLLGPVLAGVIVATIGPGWAFAVDSATFLLSAVFLTRIRNLGVVEPPGSTFLNDLVDGWRIVRSRTWLLVDGILSAVGNAVIIAPIFVLGPLVAVRSLDGPKSWAVISAGFGLGAILGGAAALRFKPMRPLFVGWTLLALFGLPAALLGIPAATLLIAAGALCAGAAINFANTMFETAVQQHVPAGAVSRATAFAWFLGLLLHPLGLGAVGPVSHAIGIRTTLFGAAAWSVIASLIALSVPGVRDLRAVQDDEGGLGEDLPDLV
jgi:MFS family permease